ncbi:alpha beta hydrolase [Raphidocelis subcapitata]|uniref:Alpha beta hydrolase n=1 Tax=Raphidocelis subcapitata TaxID=307507 RepID=A0A2V0NSU8_9CHLO|nr:alpha beta hydrolase [Raphidocelis subcapitata]|eukprot:GBF90704.1 alpha beta hydrolase [Raphidocelis subcapitata]
MKEEPRYAEDRVAGDWALPSGPSRSDASETGCFCSDLEYTVNDQRSPFSSFSFNFADGGGSYDARGLPGACCGASTAGSSTLTSGSSGSVSAGPGSCLTSSSLVRFLWPVKKRSYAVRAADGVRLHATRARCAAAAAARPRGHPVLLIPGLASSSEATWDITPELSLVDHLARQGFDVWAVDLRGNGKSGAPRMLPLSEGWCVDDHLFQDLPALVDMIVRETGSQQLHWIGHSMGGMLATGAMSLQGALSRHVRSVVMLGSGCFGAGSWHSVLRPFVSVLCWPGFHGVLAGAIVGPLVRTHALSLVESAFYWRSNTELSVASKLLRTCFRFIPRGLVSQFMNSMNSPQGLTSADGSFRYCEPKALRHARTPVLGITGDWDLFCPPPGGLRTVQQFGGEHRRFVFLGPAYGTAKSHYGHFDVIMGKNAREEVWPHITAFLAEHDAPDVSAGLSAASSLSMSAFSEASSAAAAAPPAPPGEAAAAAAAAAVAKAAAAQAAAVAAAAAAAGGKVVA